MSNKIIKWGFIGCGEVTKYKSGPAFQKVEGSKVVAVMSRDGKKAKAYAKERNIPKWYDDAQELIDDPEVNAVYIATPPQFVAANLQNLRKLLFVEFLGLGLGVWVLVFLHTV